MAGTNHEGGAIVVTGGAGGIGVAIATQLAETGHRVVVADLDRDGAEAVAERLGSRVEAARLDVTDAAACQQLAAQVEADHGLAVWINNAGVFVPGPAFAADPAATDRMFAVNTHGVINGSRAALDVFRSTGRGHVVNVVSLAGLVPPPGETVYAATKHAALAWSVGTLHDLRLAGHRRLHVSAVCPDGVWTPMLHERVDDPNAAASWQGVLLQPEDVARVVLDVVARPRPVVSVPRRRGTVRLYAAFPRLVAPFLRLIMWRARGRQAAFRRRHVPPGG